MGIYLCDAYGVGRAVALDLCMYIFVFKFSCECFREAVCLFVYSQVNADSHDN